MPASRTDALKKRSEIKQHITTLRGFPPGADSPTFLSKSGSRERHARGAGRKTVEMGKEEG